MPTFPKEAIKEILEGLDHKDNAIWTDDGSPLVTEVQRLANDKTVTRAQINDALPGFARKTSESVTEEVQPGDEADEPGPLDAPVVEASGKPKIELEGADLDLSPEDEQGRLRALAHQRVTDAEVALTEAKAAVSEAQRVVVNAEGRLTRALNLYSAKYPPISVAENIKQHLARQQELLYERVTGVKPGTIAVNPIDATLMDRKRNNGRNGQGRGQASFLPRAAVSH